MKFTKGIVCLLSLSLFSGLALANSGSFTINLSSTPTPLNCSASDRYVSSVTINAAGAAQKAYVGMSDLNTVTLHHVVKIIFPNTVVFNGVPTYTQSEAYTISVPFDGIDLCSLYVAAVGTYGQVTVNFTDNFSSYPGGITYAMKLYAAGPVTGSCSNMVCSNQPEMQGLNLYGSYSRFEFWVIPGDGEKVKIGFQHGGADFQRELYLNSGDTTQEGAHSEGFAFNDPARANSLAVTDLTIDPELGGSVLFSGWLYFSGTQFQFNGQYTPFANVSKTITVPTTATQVVAPNTLTYSNSPNLSPSSGTTNGATRFSAVMVPGSCGKVDVLYGTSLLKTLVANCKGGWSDSFVYEGPDVDATKFYMRAQAYAVPVLIGITPGNPNPTAQLKGGLLTWPSAHSAIPVPYGTVAAFNASTLAGGSGKAYVGACDMNTATGYHVAAILFPATVPYEKEEGYSVADPRAVDSINSIQLCITGDVAGESVTTWAVSSGVTSSYFNGKWGTPLMQLVNSSGVVNSANGSLPTALTGSSSPVAVFRAQAIPGQAGSTVYGTAGMSAIQQPDPNQNSYYKTLLSNQGNASVSDAHSETLLLVCAGGTNCLDLHQVYFWQQYGGQALYSAWVISQ